MNKPKVSIIIPMYNASLFIERCISSIQNQTLKEIEIIIINDGSTDDSLTLVNSMFSSDGRIRIISTENKGPSAARNAGIKLAYGEFIGFVDSDDWVEPNMFQVLYNKAKETGSDLAICNANTVHSDKLTEKRLKFSNKNIDFQEFRTKEIADLIDFKYDNANWNKIYSRKHILKYDIHFKEDISLGEDLLFNLYYFLHSNRGVTINNNLYNYCVRSNSLYFNAKTEIFYEFNKQLKHFEHYCISLKRISELNTFKKKMAQKYYFTLLPKGISSIVSNKLSFFKSIKQIDELLSINDKNILSYLDIEDFNFYSRIKIYILKHSMYKLYAALLLTFSK